jgi:hypothetical protein
LRRVLLDEGVPIGVRRLLAGFSVQSVAEAAWAGLSNGALIEVAEQAGFEVMVTADQNIRSPEATEAAATATDVAGC